MTLISSSCPLGAVPAPCTAPPPTPRAGQGLGPQRGGRERAVPGSCLGISGCFPERLLLRLPGGSKDCLCHGPEREQEDTEEFAWKSDTKQGEAAVSMSGDEVRSLVGNRA